MQHSERFLRFVEETKGAIKETSVSDVQQDLDSGNDFLLIDTREESEWATGHAKGAIHLGKGIIERDIETIVPDTSRKIVLYCGGGYRSALAAGALQKMGYGNVYSLAGGWRAWRTGEMPTVKPVYSCC
jgi:rhodanese-related sulfurtransferase